MFEMTKKELEQMFEVLKNLKTNQGIASSVEQFNWSWLHRMVFSVGVNQLMTEPMPLDTLFRFHKGLLNMSMSNNALLNMQVSHVYGRDLENQDLYFSVAYNRLLKEVIAKETAAFEKTDFIIYAEVKRILDFSEVELWNEFEKIRKGQKEMSLSAPAAYPFKYRNTTADDYLKIRKDSPVDSLAVFVNSTNLWFSNSKVMFISTSYEDMWTQKGFKDGPHLINAAAACIRMLATVSQRISEGNAYYYLAKHLFNSYLSIGETMNKLRREKNVTFWNKAVNAEISGTAVKESDKFRLEFLYFLTLELMRNEIQEL